MSGLRVERPLGIFVLGYVLLAAALITAGALSFRDYERQHRAAVERELAAVAKLKIDGLNQWRRERLGDAAALAGNEVVAELAGRCLDGRADSPACRRLAGSLATLWGYGEYDRISLLDARGREHLLAFGAAERADRHVSADAADLLGRGTPVFLDFHRHDAGTIHVAVAAPIRVPGGDGQAVGLILLRIDPAQYLWPLLSRWPTSSTSAETLLVQRDGDEVLFLNPLRYDPDAAVRLRFPLSRTDVPAVAAVGREGHFEGRDYRGVPVIAHLRAVPDSPWRLVARMDLAELSAPVRERLGITIAVTLCLLVAAAAGGALLWRQGTLQLYRERLETERERAWLQDVIARSVNEVFVFDAATLRFTFVNRGACRNLGYTLEELRSLTPLDLKPRFDAESFARLIEPVRTGKVPLLNFETAHRRKDGSEYPVEVHLQLVDSARGPVFLAVVDDITERARIEARLRLNEARLESMLDISERQYADERGLLDDALRKALVLTGSTCGYLSLYSEETRRLTLVSWSAETQDECALPEHKADCSLDAAGLWGGAVRQRQPILLNDFAAPNPLKKGWPAGHVPLRNFLSIPVFRGYEIVAVVGVANREEGYEGSDTLQLTLLLESVWRLVERNRAEAELRERNAELERFIYTISHDLKSPLVTIKTFLSYLDEDLNRGNRERVSGDLRYLITASEKMSALLDDLLQLSRVGRVPEQPVTVGFNELAAEAVALVAGAIEARGVEVRILPATLFLRGDRARLLEIWQNLIENGVKFMGDQMAPRIEIGAEGQGKDAVFRVSDNGGGFDPRYRERIFGLFERLDATVEGTGLGLALVKRIVERYGGSIRAESEGLGRGATFRFTLPGAIPPRPHPEAQP